MVTEGDLLVRAVCAAPDDDLPRLVFADWLDENGNPEWSEFIRVQCEIEREITTAVKGWMPSEQDFATQSADELQTLFKVNNWNRERRREELRRREKELWNSKNIPLAVPIKALDRNYRFFNLSQWRRGFPFLAAADHFTEEVWLEHGHEVLKLIPLELVPLKGKTPGQITNHGWHCRVRTQFTQAGAVSPSSLLAPEFFDLLPEDVYQYDDVSLGRWWRHGGQAERALRIATVKHARTRAGIGLPQLPQMRAAEPV